MLYFSILFLYECIAVHGVRVYMFNDTLISTADVLYNIGVHFNQLTTDFSNNTLEYGNTLFSENF